jgi:2-polyprenyl-3-methyl-5-hydroxy-6-metoxy-1,4-benzoquinol methylase
MKIFPCPLCKSTSAAVLRTRVRYGIKRKVLKCKRCQMVYLERASGVKKFYGTKTYRATYGPTLGKKSSSKEVFTTYRPFQDTIVKRLAPIVRKNMKVLDVGCSTGHFLDALKGKVKTRVGLELSQDEASFIRKNLDFPVYSAPIEEEKIKEGPFDLITCFQVLEHIEDPLSFLKALGKNLKPNGLLYLELPNIDDVLLTVYESKEYADFYFREPHLSYFSAKTLSTMLKNAGFIGRIRTVQDYNLSNHLQWLLARGPQGNFTLGHGTPALVRGEKAKTAAGHAINDFFAKTDLEYKKLIEEKGLGESLTFLGKKTSTHK